MKGSRSSGMPMLEIVLSIGIFTIISVFILQLFLSADSLERQAKDISKAVIYAENVAEVIKSYGSVESGMNFLGFSKNFGILEYEIEEKWSKKEMTHYVLSYDQDWNITKEERTYEVIVIPELLEEDLGSLSYVYIYVYHTRDNKLVKTDTSKKELYSLKVAVYSEDE